MKDTIFTKELWRKELIAWYFYDFANSVLIIDLSLYFSQWVVVDKKLTDFWFAFPFIIATAILIFLSPYFGELGDRKNNHRGIFIWTSIAAIISGFLIYFSGRYFENVAIALIFYGLFQFFVQLALVPYTAFIKFIASKGLYGRVSGIGLGFSQLGYVGGILLSLPIINNISESSGDGHLVVIIPATIAFLIFALPSFFIIKSIQTEVTGIKDKLSLWKTFWKNLTESRERPRVFRFLISFYFFSDAIMTITLFSAIYLQNVFNMPDPIKAKIFLFVIFGDLLGSLVGGIISDRVGHHKILVVSLLGTIATITAIALTRASGAAVILFPLFGFAMGIAYSAGRAYLASLIPSSESGKFFGMYAFAERFASIIGPAIWGLAVWLFAAFSPWNYRLAALAMAILVVIGIIPLVLKIKGPVLNG